MPNIAIKILLVLSFLSIAISPSIVQAVAVTPLDDSILARRYERFLKYEKYQLYKEYKKVKNFKNYKKYSDLYRLYKSNQKKYSSYAKYKSYYDGYQKYNKKKKYAKYSKYAFFNTERNKKYGSAMYEAAHKRVLTKASASGQSQPSGAATVANYVGSPKIKVGLTSYKKSDLGDKSITVKVNGASQVREEGGNTLGKIPDNTEIRIFFDFSEKQYRVVSVNLDVKTSKAVIIDPDNKEQGICYVTNVGSYRGSIEVRFAGFTKNLWVINELPIEYYVWGMGEATNSSPVEYLKALCVAYRTYGYWKVKNGTSYEKEGFHVTDTGSSQVYGGYGREDNQPNIVSAAKATSGTIVKYGDRIAITPYCSGTDGNTRDWKDVWGSSNYPWCKSVPDPFGIKGNAKTLAGNHMVGMSATGAYNYAKDHGWSYDKILTYYYQGVTLTPSW